MITGLISYDNVPMTSACRSSLKSLRRNSRCRDTKELERMLPGMVLEIVVIDMRETRGLVLTNDSETKSTCELESSSTRPL